MVSLIELALDRWWQVFFLFFLFRRTYVAYKPPPLPDCKIAYVSSYSVYIRSSLPSGEGRDYLPSAVPLTGLKPPPALFGSG